MTLKDVELAIGIVQFITILATLLGTLIGFYKMYKSFKDSEKKKQKEKEEKEKNEKKELLNEISSLKKDIIDLKLEQRVNEKDRLKDTILNFAEKVRYNKHNPQVYDININSYNVIFDDYTKYKELGGNSYVDEEMKFIRKEFQNLHYEEE